VEKEGNIRGENNEKIEKRLKITERMNERIFQKGTEKEEVEREREKSTKLCSTPFYKCLQ
jgi:hypothetical protein